MQHYSLSVPEWLPSHNLGSTPPISQYQFTQGKLDHLKVVQSLSCVWLFATLWTVACQAPLSFSISWSLLKFMSLESVMLCNHLIPCHPLLLLPSIFPSIRIFSNESGFAWGGQSIRDSASATILPMNIQSWSPLGWTGLISFQGNQDKYTNFSPKSAK